MSAGEHCLALPAGYELGKYCFREVLGAGGFGITYLAEDRMLSRRVAVMELLPNDIATRVDGTTVVARTRSGEESLTWARERFVSEGRALAACDHANVVRVYEMVEANGTAYMVTKYEEGRNLERWLKELGRQPNETELRGILMPLLAGLETVHNAGFLHRDIKPGNIYLTSEGRPVLLDFGSARQAISNRSMAMTSIVTSGYAPFEQYHEDGNQGPWSDIYAMGAVMYRAIVGKKPPESTRRLKSDPCERLAARYAGQYDAAFLKAIDKALSVNESKRPQSVAEWRGMLSAGVRDAATFTRKDRKDRKEELEGFALIKDLLKKNPWVAPAAGAGVAALGLLAWGLRSKPVPAPPGHDTANVAAASPTAVAVATPESSPVHAAAEPRPSPVVLAQQSPASPPSPVMPMPTLTRPADQMPPAPTPASAPTPNAALTPNAAPTPSAAPTPVAAPTPNAASTPNAAPTPGQQPATVAAPVDPKLVGTWQSGATRSKCEHWQVWADGQWVSWGVINDSGTLTAGGGHLKQFSNTHQNSLDSAYEFDDATLITHTQSGTVKWHKPGTASTSTKHHSQGN